MSRKADTVEELLEETSSIEEAENCDINEIFTCSLPGGVEENKTDEERKLCSLEFSDLSIDCSEERKPLKDISKEERKTLKICNSLRNIHQLDTGLEFLNKDSCAEGDLLPFEEYESFEICDLDMIRANIEAMEFDSFIGDSELKSSSDERKQDCIQCEKSTQTVEESAENVIELNNQITKYRNIIPFKLTIQNPNPTLEYPSYLKRFNITDDLRKQGHLNIPVCEESNEIVEVFETEVIKCEKYLQKNSDTTVLSISKTVIEQSVVSENPDDQSQIEISRNVGGRPNLKKAQLIEVLNYLERILSIVDNIEYMNNRLTEIVDSLFKKQQRLQELIIMIHEQLVMLRLLPTQVIFVDNEYTVGKMKFNVLLFGECIFEKLKSMKTELNRTFRECSGFRKNFGYVSRKICLIPFDLMEDMESTLDRTIGLYYKVCRVYKKRKRMEMIGEKISSQTLSMVSLAHEFDDYLNILNESLCNERLV